MVTKAPNGKTHGHWKLFKNTKRTNNFSGSWPFPCWRAINCNFPYMSRIYSIWFSRGRMNAKILHCVCILMGPEETAQIFARFMHVAPDHNQVNGCFLSPQYIHFPTVQFLFNICLDIGTIFWSIPGCKHQKCFHRCSRKCCFGFKEFWGRMPRIFAEQCAIRASIRQRSIGETFNAKFVIIGQMARTEWTRGSVKALRVNKQSI